MQILIILSLLFGILSPDVAYPQWASYDCEYPDAFIHVIWRNPPPEALPLDINGGYLSVNYPGHLDTYAWRATYYEADVNTYHWYGYYNHPQGVDYSLNGYIKNQAGAYFLVIETNLQPCLKPDIYIPIFTK